MQSLLAVTLLDMLESYGRRKQGLVPLDFEF